MPIDEELSKGRFFVFFATTRVVVTTTERFTTTEEAAETTTTTPTTEASLLSSSALASLSTTTLPSASVTVVVVSASQTSTASGTLASSGSSNSSSGPSTGAVVGIVAGALLGVVVVAALVTQFLKRRRRSSDDDDTSPFERDEYRRGSVMLEDDLDAYGEAHHSPDPYYVAGGAVQMQQMTEYANLDRSNTMGSQGSLALTGLTRNGTLGTPRPPSGLIQHVAYQQQHHQQQQHHKMAPPNFGPGQVLSAMPPPIAFPAGAPAATGLNYANSMSGLSRSGSGGAFGSGPYRAPSNDRQLWQQPQSGLDRQGSISSVYSTRSEQPHAGTANGYAAPGGAGISDEQGQRLSLVREEHESDTQSLSYPIVRSGTPTNSNVQQTFFSHRHEDSFDGAISMNGTSGTVITSLPGYDSWTGARPVANDGGAKGRLSVVNGGLNDFDREEGEGYHDAYRR
ncbi:BQ2448_5041 [Microbotryum intermedium]|uniref:BQ2448_5041 protein n=1 Tax=Microbotryum intermedium TaxID=269621 RepID=A0A238EZX7_9BASI|nr:BQ2448_5041 [Microbotryum intermedium]